MTLKEMFLRNSNAQNKSKSTNYTILHALNECEKDIGKPLEQVEWQDILTHLEQLQQRGVSKSTTALRKSKLKQFFRFCYEETDDIRFRKILKNLKGNKIVGEAIRPQDLLTPEDVKRAINVCTLERDRAIISTLFESGMRIGELLALRNDMILLNESAQEVTFNIPNQEGCKTGSRSVVCLEIFNYVQEWMKCNPSDVFIPISMNGVRVKLKSIFRKAGLTKPCNPHIFRHSAITHAVTIGMQLNAISMRFWGISNSNMLSTYIHLSEAMTAQGYRNAKGMGNGNGNVVINPLACRCVQCGRLIQIGDLCKPCEDTKKLSQENQALKQGYDELKSQMDSMAPLMNEMMLRLQNLNAKQANPINIEDAILKEMDTVIVGKQKVK